MKTRKLLTGTLVFLGFTGSLFGVVYNRQTIIDWVRLRNYVPSAEIASLATEADMNSNGRKIFYVNHPVLQGQSEFNDSCDDSEQTIVLGCYIRNRGIYLYRVTDKRLDGVEEVTAAHEMLHAAYDRLSNSEKQRIDSLTQQAFQNSKNSRIKKTIEAYRAKDADVVANELHSIIGTEVRDIPKELEDYYRKYFENRLTVVALSEAYESIFTEIENKAVQLRAELEAKQAAIKTSVKDLDRRATELNAEYEDLERRRATAEPVSFNIQVRRYNNDVLTYNNDVQSVNAQIDEYERLRKEYNAIVGTQNELIEAIDSRPQSIQTN